MYELANPYYTRRRRRRGHRRHNPFAMDNPRRHGRYGRRHNPVEASVRHYFDKENLTVLAGVVIGTIATQKIVDSFGFAGWAKVLGALGAGIGLDVLGSMASKDIGTGLGLGGGAVATMQAMAIMNIGGVQQGSLIIGGNHPKQLPAGIRLPTDSTAVGTVTYKP